MAGQRAAGGADALCLCQPRLPDARLVREQSLVGESFRKVGDMPHNWASAEFIRLVVDLLALDRGDELHLLEGFPWCGRDLGLPRV